MSDGREGGAESGPCPLDLDRIVRRHGQRLQACALRLLRDRSDALDLVQDAYTRALESAPAVRTERHALAWLARVMTNLAIDRSRKRLRRRHVGDALLTELPAETPDAAPPEQDRALLQEQVGSCLERLSAPLRDAYRLHAIDGCSYREIASRLAIPESTVGTRLLRARRKLRAALVRVGRERARAQVGT